MNNITLVDHPEQYGIVDEEYELTVLAQQKLHRKRKNCETESEEAYSL